MLATNALRCQERRQRQSRSYRVDADTGRRELPGEGAGEVGYCGFAGAVVDCEGVGLGDDAGGGEDYAAAWGDWDGRGFSAGFWFCWGDRVLSVRLTEWDCGSGEIDVGEDVCAEDSFELR